MRDSRGWVTRPIERSILVCRFCLARFLRNCPNFTFWPLLQPLIFPGGCEGTSREWLLRRLCYSYSVARAPASPPSIAPLKVLIDAVRVCVVVERRPVELYLDLRLQYRL